MREKIIANLKKMTGILSEMINLVYQGFMENDTHYLNSALNKERIMDDLEKEITASVVHDSKTLDEKGQKDFLLLAQVAENLERMGDELRYLMERIEIKIAENLLFSDIGVEQYKEVFEKMRKSVSPTIKFLNENKDELLERILNNGDDIKETVEKYRVEHLKRLTRGICEPRAANMYFDMLDFTGNIARHCTAIARIYKEK
ncbi:MAG: Na/Pi cotransporter family protein [Candidatus Omnitrophica bacterium]|nr:Na/Pi cotransporter family protein [Candidatus Omnitrophota bacterium]